jgi:site-specific recombinase XerD
MRQEISGFLAYVRAEKGFSAKTIDAYRHDLGKYSEFAAKELGKNAAVADIDQYSIKAYMQFLTDTGYQKPCSAVTRGRKLATIKSFFKYLLSDGKVKVNPADKVRCQSPKKRAVILNRAGI